MSVETRHFRVFWWNWLTQTRLFHESNLPKRFENPSRARSHGPAARRFGFWRR
uniref:Uncharacterized protein n=1 Tax=Ralstonia syzygii R24 TaxID=907261 RepID=G3A9H5_9RALS|nr:hypothetical protein RALSY_mp10470 [Ralstonia syzygii R24]